jgi:hypothetical protein
MGRRRAARPKEVFLSHSSKDRGFVNKLENILRAVGIRYWYSKRHIAAATQWHDEIGNALARCDWFVVILSPSALRSLWVKRELLYALRKRRYSDRIVPVLYVQCDWGRLSWTLENLQMVDFTRGFEAGCRGLLWTWGLKYRGERSKRSHRGARPVRNRR